MLQQHETFEAHDLLVREPDTLEQLPELPELPEGVVIPDDLRDLTPERRSRRRLVRWGWWAAALALFIAGSVVAVMQLSDDPHEYTGPFTEAEAYDLKQQAIDERVALIEQRVPDVKEFYVDIYQARLAFQADLVAKRDVPAYDLKQQAIDERVALIEQRVPDVKEFYVDIYQARLEN